MSNVKQNAEAEARGGRQLTPAILIGLRQFVILHTNPPPCATRELCSLRSGGSQELSCFSRNSNSLVREAFDERRRLHGLELEKLIKAIRIF